MTIVVMGLVLPRPLSLAARLVRGNIGIWLFGWPRARGRRIDQPPDDLFELGAYCRLVGVLQVALLDFVRVLEDPSPFFCRQFVIDRAEGRYVAELHKVFVRVSLRTPRCWPFRRLTR